MVATFETALKLRDAGFPQPEFADGQRWYLKNNPKNIIAIIENNEGHENGMVPAKFLGAIGGRIITVNLLCIILLV